MALLVLLFIFVAALVVTMSYGLTRTAVYVYLPVVLCLIQLHPTKLPGIPDLTSISAIGYAIVFVLCFRASEFKLVRFNMLDGLMLCLFGWTMLSFVATTGLWQAISAGGSTFFTWLMPYALGRVVMLDADARRRLLPVVCLATIVTGLLAMIEARLMPFVVSRMVEEKTGLISTFNTMVMYRYGFARSQVLTPHPIDLGNVGVLLGTIILILTPVLGRRWNQPLPLMGILGAGMMVFASISFTCFFALAAAIGFYIAFSLRGLGPRLVLPALCGIILGLVAMTAFLLGRDVDLENTDFANAAEGSLWMRTVIVQGSWKVAQVAGLFGFTGEIPGEKIGTGSIDNAYMLFIMRRGWPYIVLWALLGLGLAWRGTTALARTRSAAERYPMAAGLAGLMAILLAMYTVWYGFVYAQLFVFVLGMVVSMTQMFEQREKAPALQHLPMNEGPLLRPSEAWARPA